MEIKDIEVQVECMDEVRGGANFVSNSSSIGGLYSANSNSARNLHGGGQSITSTNVQSNLVDQKGKIEDITTHTTSLSILNSSFDFSFGGFGRPVRMSL